MFGLRFGKENQAEQFLSTVKRMASTLAKASELMKQEHDRKVKGLNSGPFIDNTLF